MVDIRDTYEDVWIDREYEIDIDPNVDEIISEGRLTYLRQRRWTLDFYRIAIGSRQCQLN
jgi:hypothetical protein